MMDVIVHVTGNNFMLEQTPCLFIKMHQVGLSKELQGPASQQVTNAQLSVERG